MTPTAAILAGVLTMSEPEFFNPDPGAMTAREAQLLDADFIGVEVNAPPVVDTRSRNKLPLFIAARFEGDREWDVPLRENCILVGTNLHDGSVYFAPALISEKDVTRSGREPIPKGPKPEGLPLVAAQITEIDAKAKLPIRWNSGAWSLGVINLDRRSNTVSVELKGDEALPAAAARDVHPPPNHRAEGLALPSYTAMERTPPIPDSGAAFSVEYSQSGGRQRLIVFGAVSVPVREHMLSAQTITHEFAGGRSDSVAAVVPITFILVALNQNIPIQFDWAIPVYGESLEAGMPARACFAIDALAADEPASIPAGQYFCYVVVGGRIFGPEGFVVE